MEGNTIRGSSGEIRDQGQGSSRCIQLFGVIVTEGGQGPRPGPSSPINIPIPRSLRYPVRLPLRHGCAVFGCFLPVQNDSPYCCEPHQHMAEQMDGAIRPCIVFDGFKEVDSKLCLAILNRTVGGVAVGVPTMANQIFARLPWEIGQMGFL